MSARIVVAVGQHDEDALLVARAADMVERLDDRVVERSLSARRKVQQAGLDLRRAPRESHLVLESEADMLVEHHRE